MARSLRFAISQRVLTAAPHDRGEILRQGHDFKYLVFVAHIPAKVKPA